MENGVCFCTLMGKALYNFCLSFTHSYTLMAPELQSDPVTAVYYLQHVDVKYLVSRLIILEVAIIETLKMYESV